MTARCLIAGSGYVGNGLATHLRHHTDFDVWTLSRRIALPHPNALTADLTRPESLALPPDLTHIAFCAGLQNAAPQAYAALFVDGVNHLLDALADHPLQRFIFVSTTGVYSEQAGGWVDEDTPPAPMRPPARYYLEAEEICRRRIPDKAVIARLSGIYGPGRCRLIQQVRDGTARLESTDAPYINQIHQEDIVGALTHLLFHPHPAPTYLLTDSEPAKRNEVLLWLANRLHVSAPPYRSADEPPLRRRGGNKRCRNQRLRASGYNFRYPTYREGYATLLDTLTA